MHTMRGSEEFKLKWMKEKGLESESIVDDRVPYEPWCVNCNSKKLILKDLCFFPIGWSCKSPDRCGIGKNRSKDLFEENELVLKRKTGSSADESSLIQARPLNILPDRP
ncbi:hypothetical protein AVEN_213258-1 [Araneus ventricosus]|uniref:Uncharacterized protein n=1 Tax=Araneus ventricosus TaxID=182803 RepID=A0A4Y2DE12_ARAVE|nr:hypothetical protein AVEN_213258-1 [Araneus ventricosus]